jgi:hypothetical protein
MVGEIPDDGLVAATRLVRNLHVIFICPDERNIFPCPPIHHCLQFTLLLWVGPCDFEA